MPSSKFFANLKTSRWKFNTVRAAKNFDIETQSINDFSSPKAVGKTPDPK